MKCPNCGFDSSPEMRFCGMCGVRLALVCATCGFANPPNYRFCGNCGVRLIDEQNRLIALPAPSRASQPEAERINGEATTQPVVPIIPLEGERRVATVVVTDLAGSTALLERIGTEAWVETMNRVLHILEAEINRFGGEVEQFRGDGLVAFFGATTAHEDDPERAVLAALSMHAALQSCAANDGIVFRHAQRTDGNDGDDIALALRLRVGVSTGEVIVAGAGERRPHSETAMGMAVATAARMETAAEPGTVLVSEATYRLTEAQFEWQPLGEITVRGLSHPIKVYRPLAPRFERSAVGGDDHPRRDREGEQTDTGAHEFQFSVPLIGREQEFDALKGCVQDVLAGRGRIVMLTGDKGLGKSFLVRELRQQYAHRSQLLAWAEAHRRPDHQLDHETWSDSPLSFLQGRCRSYHQGWPYSMWIDVLHDWLSVQSRKSSDDLRACLREQSEALWGDDYVEHYPYLATLLALPLEDNFTERVRHLDGERLRQGYFFALRSWVEAMSRRAPLVLVFADMQWADTSSLDVLKYCLSLCDTEAVLCLLVFRPERDQAVWEFSHYVESEYPHRLTQIELAPLSAEESRRLIGNLIGQATLPADTCDLIVKNAAGNPYYIQELIRSLIINGVLVRDEQTEQWRATRAVTTLDLPSSLQRLLRARIDRLSVEERFVLQVASVIGSVFWSNVVRALIYGEARETPSPLTSHLIALQRARLIQETGRMPELGMQYLFATPLLRDAAYESLLRPQRIAYHARTAEFLEAHVSADTLVGYYGLLAHHYHHAENRRKELFYTLLAAEQARKLYANAEALQRYTRALELLDDMQEIVEVEAGRSGATGGERLRAIQTQRFEVLKGRAEVLVAMGEVQAAQADARALLPLARAMADDPAWLIDALLAQIDMQASDPSREEVEESLRMAYEALDLSRQTGDAHREMLSLMAVAQIGLYLGRPDAREAAERALQLAQQLGDLRAEVNLLVGFSAAYGIDDLERSQAYLQKALARSEQLDDKATEIVLLGEISAQFERSGDYYRQLVEYAHKRLRISREIGNRFVEGDALMYCGQIQGIYLGDYEGGLALQQEALRKWEPITSKLFPMLRIAQIQTMMGELAEAQATLDQARPIGGNILLELGRVGLGLVTAILYNALGDEVHLRMALDLTSQVHQMAANNLISRQYRMAAACIAAASHLQLARLVGANANGHSALEEREQHLRLALESSQTAVEIYEHFGFTQIVECTGEEVLFRRAEALAANTRDDEAIVFLRRAYDETMRKHDLIPPDSHFRRTFLDIRLHREIRAAYQEQHTQP